MNNSLDISLDDAEAFLSALSFQSEVDAHVPSAEKAVVTETAAHDDAPVVAVSRPQATTAAPTPASDDPASGYQARKPKWWKALSGKASKGQRRIMSAMTDYKLQRPEYGNTIDWKTVFTNCNDVWIELGFGGGDNLLALAQQYPDINFVGAEINQQSLGKVYSRMNQAVEQGAYWTAYDQFDPNGNNDASVPDEAVEENAFSSEQVDSPYSNLRIYSGDGVKLLPYLATASVSTILVTFPDPFEREHQKDLRLIQEQTLKSIHRVLKTNGRLFLATDHEGCHSYSTSAIDELTSTRAVLFRPVTPCPDRMSWLSVISKYERKGWTEGRSTHLSCWETSAATTVTTASRSLQQKQQPPPGEGIKVLCAGLGRTGTFSLTDALQYTLGYKCYHYIDFNHAAQWAALTRGETDTDAVLDLIVKDGYTAVLDNPGCDIYQDILRRYPDVKVILTVRDSPHKFEESWKVLMDCMVVTERGFSLTFPSFFGWIPLFRRLKELRYFMGTTHLGLQPGELTHGWRDKPTGWLAEQYERHTQHVIDHVPSKQLLVFNVKQGWKPLCDFLGCKEPLDEPFPHSTVNDSKALKSMRKTFVVAVYAWIPVVVSVSAGAVWLAMNGRRSRR